MILDIFNKNKPWIICTYTILLLEYIVFAMYPWLLGKSLDSLIDGKWDTFYWYVGICASGMIVGTVRRIIDTRAFMRIWADTAVKAINGLIARKVPSPKIISRSDLIDNYTDFLEFTIPTTVASIIEITVSLVMIWIAIGSISIWIAIMLVISIISSYFWSCLMQRLEMQSQKIREKVNHAISDKNEEEIEKGYKELVPRYIRESDYDAASWAIVDVFSIIAEIILIVCLVRETASTGTIMYSVTYCWKVFVHAGILSYFFVNYKYLQIADRFIKHED